MPYSVVQGGGDCGDTQWAVLNKDSGRTMGCHASKQEAIDQQSALYVHADDDGSTNRAHAAPQAPRGRMMTTRNASISERDMGRRHRATMPHQTNR